ncbi:helix-turn-helix domain-containing protein [Dokdonella sp. MW10]|uniref:helix-turn-helix domain-containing protein n=1 Tax=Dokdonella sp. MW10 TaxID=2992926 RepID=UPI003F7FD804
MAIRITLDELLARRGMTAKHLATLVGVSETHLSLFRGGKVKGVRFSTLDKLCRALDCQPADLLVHDPHAVVEDDEADV